MGLLFNTLLPSIRCVPPALLPNTLLPTTLCATALYILATMHCVPTALLPDSLPPTMRCVPSSLLTNTLIGEADAVVAVSVVGAVQRARVCTKRVTALCARQREGELVSGWSESWVGAVREGG